MKMKDVLQMNYTIQQLQSLGASTVSEMIIDMLSNYIDSDDDKAFTWN